MDVPRLERQGERETHKIRPAAPRFRGWGRWRSCRCTNRTAVCRRRASPSNDIAVHRSPSSTTKSGRESNRRNRTADSPVAQVESTLAPTTRPVAGENAICVMRRDSSYVPYTRIRRRPLCFLRPLGGRYRVPLQRDAPTIVN